MKLQTGSFSLFIGHFSVIVRGQQPHCTIFDHLHYFAGVNFQAIPLILHIIQAVKCVIVSFFSLYVFQFHYFGTAVIISLFSKQSTNIF